MSSDPVVEFHIVEDESISPKNQTMVEAGYCFVKFCVDYFANVYLPKDICPTPCDCFEKIKIGTNCNSFYIPVDPTTTYFCAAMLCIFGLPEDERQRISEEVSSKIRESMLEKNEGISDEVSSQVGTSMEEKNKKREIAHEVSSKASALRDDHRYRKMLPSFLVEIKYDEYHLKESQTEIKNYEGFVKYINFKVPYSSLQSMQVMKQHSKSESRYAEDCAICLRSLQDEEEEGQALQLPCSHDYHFGCMVDWSRESPTCPSCRAKIQVDIGSLAEHKNEDGVENVTVTNVVFRGTQNGVRIKSWGRPSTGYAKNIVFGNIVMKYAYNPIIIDQNYCPSWQGCPKHSSGVKISGVTYKNIKGTSFSQAAMKFNCSSSHPCEGLKLEDIKLTYCNRSASATSSCTNASGSNKGVVIPPSCLSS